MKSNTTINSKLITNNDKQISIESNGSAEMALLDLDDDDSLLDCQSESNIAKEPVPRWKSILNAFLKQWFPIGISTFECVLSFFVKINLNKQLRFRIGYYCIDCLFNF
jgi:hypothetical protein